MKIALVTCASLPEWECDDQPLVDYVSRIADVRSVAWDQPVDWAMFDAAVIRTTWDYTRRIEEYLAWVDTTSKQTKMYNSASWIHWNANKMYLRSLENRGIPIAPSYFLDASFDVEKELLSILRKERWEKAFLKPVIGAGAEKTLRFRPSELPKAQQFLTDVLPSSSMILQPYLSSVETRGEVSLIYFDSQFSHAVQKVPVSGDYRVQDDFGASDAPINASEGMLSLAKRVIEQLKPIPLYSRIDLLFDDERGWLLNEVELIEPSLFFRHAPHAPKLLVDAIIKRLEYK
ncbi:MAG: hypothetical protein VX278_00655, partial [Myxococcota bacterium]|nr:hypothetical protein [Myxococcota bacterium]